MWQRWKGVVAAACVAGLGLAGLEARANADKLVYADFENSADGQPISSRGGQLNLWGYEQNPTRQSVFKGPSLVRTSRDDENQAAAFEYELLIPNQWAGVTLEIQGHAGEPGALPADDVTNYKFMSLQAYATGTQYLRVEIMSNGQGINMHSGYPMTSFKLREGFNTYRVPLTAFTQPEWVTDTRIDPREVLKRLTSLTISAYCDDCRPTKGVVVVDNIVFER